MSPWIAFFIGAVVGVLMMAFIAGATQNEKMKEEFDRGVEVGRMRK